jgi:predicted GH43/DUF377 family glycosyl hydrolase
MQITEVSNPSMRWTKLGRLYQPSGQKEWAKSYAANPTAEHIKDDLFRIYFSTRDDKNRSSIGSVVIDLKEPGRILEEAADPVLSPGELAMFDDSGASIGCIINVGDARFLYYMGWNLSVTVPWKNALGLAISEAPGKPFIRYSRFPIIDLNEIDPYTISYPWVIQEGNKFRMWYGSNLKWGPVKTDMLHILKYAESSDGIKWDRPDRIVINSENPAEYAICRPTVLHENDLYSMWFCSRGDKYRIHLAESTDGLNWTRKGQDRRIDVSKEGWDSEMIEYPCVFKHNDKRYLLYAGNTFGRTGFGMAVLER